MRDGWRPAALNCTVTKVSGVRYDFFATFGHKQLSRHGARSEHALICAEDKSWRRREGEV